MKTPSKPRGEAGAASVFVLALMFALVAVAWGAGSVVAAVVAHRTAQNVADLAALAAAQELARTDGCLSAAQVAAANQARLVSCLVEGLAVTVEVAVSSNFGISTELHARARAGPAP